MVYMYHGLARIRWMQHKVLDPCCGSRMFWFDSENQLTTEQEK